MANETKYLEFGTVETEKTLSPLLDEATNEIKNFITDVRARQCIHVIKILYDLQVCKIINRLHKNNIEFSLQDKLGNLCDPAAYIKILLIWTCQAFGIFNGCYPRFV